MCKRLTVSVHIYISQCIYQTARCIRLQPLGVACHVPGNVVDPELRRQELVEVDDGWIELFTQNLLVFPFFSFLQSNRRETCNAAHVTICHMDHRTDSTCRRGKCNQQVIQGALKSAVLRSHCCAQWAPLVLHMLKVRPCVMSLMDGHVKCGNKGDVALWDTAHMLRLILQRLLFKSCLHGDSTEVAFF